MAGETRAQKISMAQLVVSLMLVGVILLTIAAIFYRPRMGEPKEEQAPLMLAILAAVSFSLLPAYGAVRKGFIKALARRHQLARAEVRNEQIPPEAFGLAIIGAGMVEAVGLFGAAIFLITGEWVALAAPALAVILIGVQIPGKESIERLIRLALEQAKGR